MSEHNLVNKLAPFLPDAPTFITLKSFEAQSPYHISILDKEGSSSMITYYDNLDQFIAKGLS